MLYTAKRTYYDQQNIALALMINARKSRSIPIARILLSKGASIDATILKPKRTNTPLFVASRYTRLKAAEFIKFCLESGADVKRAEEEGLSSRPGARNISQWFGMEWDVFVRSFSSRQRNEGV